MCGLVGGGNLGGTRLGPASSFWGARRVVWLHLCRAPHQTFGARACGNAPWWGNAPVCCAHSTHTQPPAPHCRCRLQLKYPPVLNPQLEEAAAGLSAVMRDLAGVREAVGQQVEVSRDGAVRRTGCRHARGAALLVCVEQPELCGGTRRASTNPFVGASAPARACACVGAHTCTRLSVHALDVSLCMSMKVCY